MEPPIALHQDWSIGSPARPGAGPPGDSVRPDGWAVLDDGRARTAAAGVVRCGATSAPSAPDLWLRSVVRRWAAQVLRAASLVPGRFHRATSSAPTPALSDRRPGGARTGAVAKAGPSSPRRFVCGRVVVPDVVMGRHRLASSASGTSGSTGWKRVQHRNRAAS